MTAAEDLLQLADLLRARDDAVRPAEVLRPSEWAERYRHLSSGPYAGTRWDNTISPYLVDVMDAAQEALETHRDLAVMKQAQGGVTEALGVNVVAWLLDNFGGPILYLTSVAETAAELVRDRWDGVLESCEPLRRKRLAHLDGKARDKALVKRFSDAKLVLGGSGAMSKFISQPYAVVVFDELDACQDEQADGSDPIELVRRRMSAFREARDTLLIAFAHPSERDRGIAKIYYERSDQRRAHLRCVHCGTWCAPLWKDVRALPREGQTPLQAERDPSCYALVAPCCGVPLSEADRLKMIEHVRQLSTLPPEEAKRKPWIGLHVWNLLQRVGGRVETLARAHVAGLDEPSVRRVFWNKDLGEPFEQAEQEAPVELWRRLVVDSYELGEVPEEVQFLTAGQDSRFLELHWAVWGWGLVRTAAGALLLCGWLVDAGVEPGPRAIAPDRNTLDVGDLAVFDQLLYDTTWPRRGGGALRVDVGYHDSGWQPIAAYEYSRAHPGRAIASKGAGLTSTSRAPLVSWSAPPRWKVVGADGRPIEVSDPNLKRADLNTYALKTDLLGWPSSRFAPAVGEPRARLALPAGVREDLLAHLASERLVVDGKAKRWMNRGPNHWLDCTIAAYAAATQLVPFLGGKTRAEQLAEAPAARAPRVRDDEDRPHRSQIRTRY